MKPTLIEIPMPITTERLILRHPLPGDGKSLNEAIIESMPELKTWMPWARTAPTLEESEDNVRKAYASWILREDLRVSIFDKKTNHFLGSTGLHRFNWEQRCFEIGYWARTSCVGKGYITEAANALTQFTFKELKAKRVEIKCNSKNKKSSAVAERLGYDLEGCLRNADLHVIEGHPRDTLVYSRLNLNGLPSLEVKW